MIQKRNKFTSAMDCLVIYGLQLSANFTTHAAISLNALVHNHIYLTIFFSNRKILKLAVWVIIYYINYDAHWCTTK